MNYDIAIIGGGPGGYTAAEKAAHKGLSVVLFEKDALGGTCLNRGCIPTKALLHGAALGESFSELHDRKNAVVEILRSGTEGLMKKSKVTVVNGEAFVEEAGLVSCNGEVYEAKNIIVAVGAEPSVPPIPGADREGVYTSDDLLEGGGKNLQSLIIIGGGVIGVEIGSFYASIGTQVTILEAMDHILPQMSKEIAQRAGMVLKKNSVEVFDKVQIKEITGEPGYMTVSYVNKKGEELTATADGVLMATGRIPIAEKIFKKEIGLGFERGAVVADENGETAVKGIYVIGDAKARNIQLAHVAEAQAKNVVSVICGEEPIVDMKTVPSCIYTNPEIATVGISEDDAKERGIEVRTVKIPTGSNGKCLIEGAEAGFVKLMIGEGDVILGAQLICPRATDLIAELALAVSHGMTTRDIASVIHPHPTFSEMIMAAAE
ncbi:MAG: FAD-dependent oxidoreductase [Firmicutes bacterium]|nr:FAD-dependent oxidoreductase [Bacillota bacterium]